MTLTVIQINMGYGIVEYRNERGMLKTDLNR